MRLTLIVFLTLTLTLYAQIENGNFSGHVSDDSNGQSLINANIIAKPGNQGTVTDSLGNFSFALPFGTYEILISYIGYKSEKKGITISQIKAPTFLSIKLTPKAIEQKEVFVTGEKEFFSPATQEMKQQDIVRMPTVYSDVLRSVKILAGVNSNNELTNSYNVRGGNYNENLIYLDGFEIYRPFLITKGIEENQSIVNGDLINNLHFNGGTFPARLGDKMSSALELTYRDNFDSTLHGHAKAGLLNSGLSLFKKYGKLNLAGAIRYSYPKIFAQILQTTGDYTPIYFDAQLLANYQLTKNSNLELLFINAQNKFEMIPEAWHGYFQTGFLLVKEVRLKYTGDENYKFNTRLAGARYNNKISDNSSISILGSIYSTTENYFKNLTGNMYYSDNSYDNQQPLIYYKTRYENTDDKLDMNRFELKSIYKLNTPIHLFEAGLTLRYFQFRNTVNESTYETGVDSVLNSPDNVKFQQNINFPSFSGYIQDRIYLSKQFQTEAGMRVLRYNFSNETLVSPRLSINYIYSQSGSLNFSSGVYYQPPFYYEVDNKTVINSTTSLKSQRSINLMLTWQIKTEHNSKYTFDVYYKKLDNLIPYYVDQLKLVYGDQNNYEGYARGFDFQYEGELVKGIKSWIGYSYLDTGEKIKGSSAGYTRRLLDQRHTIKVFLQDKAKNLPNFKAHVRFLFGSGYLFHPRTSVKDPATNKYYMKIDYTKSWVLPFYFRTDMGLSFKFDLSKTSNLVFIVELFNVFNKWNIASYKWYHVFPDRTAPEAVPQVFSGRFLSLNAEMNF